MFGFGGGMWARKSQTVIGLADRAVGGGGELCCLREHRDCFGGGTLVNDLRWAGSYGVQADFVAMSHCSIEFIKTSDILVFIC